ncbi:MAG: HEAT repeat domain-containing protein [Planctomycetota bacterium]|jgi:HEAT repeat protein
MTVSRRLAIMWLVAAMGAAAVAEAGAPPPGRGGDWRKALDEAVKGRDVARATGLIDAVLARRLPGAEEEFARAFRSPNAWIRRATLRGIVALGGARTVETLVQGLEDPNPLVRLDASVLAGRFPPDAEGKNRLVDALLGKLADERRGVREQAARALGRLASPTAYYGLSSTATSDRDAMVRAAAVEALGRVGGEGAPHAVREALERDEDDRVRATACIALGILRPPFAVEVLTRSLKDISGRTRGAAAEGLALVGSTEAVKALVASLALPDEDLRKAATRALGRIAGAPALEALRRLLGHERPEVRREAAQILGQRADAASLEALVRMTRDNADAVREAAVEALGRIADPRAAVAVRNAFTDRTPEVRARAAEATARLGDVGGIPELVALLQPKFTEGERVSAVAALGFIGDERVGQPLVGLLDDPSEPVRRAAASALARLGLHGRELLSRQARYKDAARVEFLGALAVARVPEARRLFEQELSREGVSEPMRYACEVGLYLLGDRSRRDAVIAGARGERRGANPTVAMVALMLARDPQGEESVRTALRSQNPAMRESAAFALGVARPDWAEPLLREAVKDGHPGVALRARVGLRWIAARKPAR